MFEKLINLHPAVSLGIGAVLSGICFCLSPAYNGGDLGFWGNAGFVIMGITFLLCPFGLALCSLAIKGIKKLFGKK